MGWSTLELMHRKLMKEKDIYKRYWRTSICFLSYTMAPIHGLLNGEYLGVKIVIWCKTCFKIQSKGDSSKKKQYLTRIMNKL